MSKKCKLLRWDNEKNALLKKERGIGFEIIESLIEDGDILDVIDHPSRPNQRIFVLEIDCYIVSVPFVETETEIFLKTLFKSRKLNKKYKESDHEVNFKEYEAADVLDEEEAELFNQLQEGEYQSVMTDELKTHYVDIFTENSKREHASTVRLTMNDKMLAKMKAKEEGVPYQVLLASIIHKWLHGRFVER